MARSPGEPRVRYIALRVDGDPALSRRDLIEAIKDTGQREHGAGFEKETGVWLTRYKDKQAIVRSHHTHQETVRSVLENVAQDRNDKPLSLTPLATSGTIRTLVEKHVPELRESATERRQKAQRNKNTVRPSNGGRPPRKSARDPRTR